MHNYTLIYHILEVATQYGDMCQRNVRALRNKPFFMYVKKYDFQKYLGTH